MNKFEVALELVKRAQQEHRRLVEYRQQLAGVAAGDWQKRAQLDAQYRRLPTVAAVNDSLKMARQLLLEAYVKE